MVNLIHFDIEIKKEQAHLILNHILIEAKKKVRKLGR